MSELTWDGVWQGALLAVCAAVLVAVLPSVDRWIEKRRGNKL